jgi:hypothetical protein
MASFRSAGSDNQIRNNEVVMIEVYAFLAAFAVLVPAISILIPFAYLKSVRAWTRKVPIERFAELGIEFQRDQARYLKRYVLLNLGLAMLGLLLLAWLYAYMQDPHWNRGLVSILTTAYFVLFVPPMLHVYLFQEKHFKLLASSFPDRKRKATLQRRGLFDFVSPVGVFLALVAYCLFAALVIYLRRNPFLGFGGLANLVIITLVYASNAFLIYSKLYGRKNPIESREDRTHTLGVVLNLYVYVPIVIVIGVSINFALAILELWQWEPFVQTVGYVIFALVMFKVIGTPPRNPDEYDFGSDESARPAGLTASADRQ